MKTENSPTQDPLLEKLIKICTDRGSRAALKRFWSPATKHYAYPVLGMLGALGKPKESDAFTVALYAINPYHEPNGSRLGQACHKLAAGKGFESFEKHFRRLLASDELEEVADQLHRIFKRMERDSIGLDYHRLLWDLRKWNKDQDNIKTDWAKDFWQAPIEALTTSDS
jgi:CRISPR type I-E-associated protein CasB/Cse2